MSFLKVEERRTLVGAKAEERQIEELVGGQNQGPEAPPRSKTEQERREERICQERSNVERWVCQGHSGREVRRDDPVEYFLPTAGGSTSRVPEGVMAIEVPQNEEVCGKRNGRKGVDSAIHWRRANRGHTH